MKNQAKILILFLMFMVFPASTAFACGKISDKDKTEKSSCSNEKHDSEMKSCCDHDENGEKDEDGCNGTCGNTACYCPSTVSLSVFFTIFKLSNIHNFTLLMNDWSYEQHNPKAVYFSIWQPPKIS